MTSVAKIIRLLADICTIGLFVFIVVGSIHIRDTARELAQGAAHELEVFKKIKMICKKDPGRRDDCWLLFPEGD